MINLKKLAGLGIGALCLSTAMFISSCSKEDAAAPQPKVEIAKSDANMKTNDLAPFIAPTQGPACSDCFPVGWKRFFPNDPAPSYAPIGTSSLTNLCGLASSPWVQALPSPGGQGAIVTTSSTFPHVGQFGKINPVAAEIKNLKSTKKYALTVQIATSRTTNSQYAKKVMLTVQDDSNPLNKTEVLVDLSANPGQWITKTITFTAHSSSATLRFHVDTDPSLAVSYGNIYVGPNAIKQAAQINW